jgi:two-component system sensor histidine kinase TctE
VKTADSLRSQLLRWLVGPLALVLVAGGLGAYWLAVRMATDAYDHSLLDPALAIAQRIRAEGGRVELDVPPGVLDALRVDSSDRIYFAVHQGGRLIAGSRDLPPPAASAGSPMYYDGALRNEPVRIAAMAVDTPSGEVTIQVAETLQKRRAIVRQVLLSGTLPELAFGVVALAIVWFGVRRGLAPLEGLRAEIASRSHRDLRPVPESHAPAEVQPLVAAINELLERLGGAMDAQGRFIADAAHQLRTPLAALQAHVEAAQRQIGTPELASTLAQLDAATRRTAHLARQLLTLARVEPSGDAPIEPQRADLASIARSRIDEWLSLADRRGIDLGFELAPAAVLAEPFLAGELAGNLVDNAVSYSPQGGAVTVRTGTRDGRGFLEVEDEGTGIPAGERERVFDRFYRIKGTPSGGSGLGLSIVREIAHRHGADVTIETPAQGRGTLLRVTFPPVVTSDAAVRDDAASNPTPAVSPL